MTTDLTFITNEQGQNLAKRFSSLIKDTRSFDGLVGYFYASGFYSIYKSLENTEKIRVLIGISTGKETYDLIQESKQEVQQQLQSSSKEVKDEFTEKVVEEMDKSGDTENVEDRLKFLKNELDIKKINYYLNLRIKKVLLISLIILQKKLNTI